MKYRRRISPFMANLQMKEQTMQTYVQKVADWMKSTKEKERTWRRKISRAK